MVNAQAAGLAATPEARPVRPFNQVDEWRKYCAIKEALDYCKQSLAQKYPGQRYIEEAFFKQLMGYLSDITADLFLPLEPYHIFCGIRTYLEGLGLDEYKDRGTEEAWFYRVCQSSGIRILDWDFLLLPDWKPIYLPAFAAAAAANLEAQTRAGQPATGT